MIYYIYNDVEDIIGFQYNRDIYYYIKNIQKDIIGILDSNYNVVATYTYDSWGTILSITDSNGLDISNDVSHIANINPFRYRGYYYDIETGTKVVAIGITLYSIYLIVKWGVAYTTATPTGGGSLIIAGMTP